MATVRSLIETELKAMEAGAFQDFCLDYLPIYHERFRGLERRGHTAEGKTRAGTPDLLKTDAEGRQTAVECGTEPGYWGPTKTIEHLKPYRDGLKCVEKLAHLGEIVLIANREVPTQTPNAKAEIIQALRAHSSVLITLVSLEEIGHHLAAETTSPAVRSLLQQHCRTVTDTLRRGEQDQKYQIAVSVSRQRGGVALTLIESVEEAFSRTLEGEEARQYVVERLDEALNVCKIRRLPHFRGIRRPSVADLALANPEGGVWVFAGVPKIGKTSALLQLAAGWRGGELHWYDIPPGGGQGCGLEVARECVRSVVRGAGDDVDDLVRSTTVLRDALARQQGERGRTIVVVDNANHLGDSDLIHLGRVLAEIKRAGRCGGLVCVCVSNRSLLGLAPAVDKVLAAPEWTAGEVGDLFALQSVSGGERETGPYLDAATALAGGHPLVALALARKSETLAELLVGALDRRPGLGDEELSREVQLLLYEDLLRDADAQSFVHRFAIVLERVPIDVLETLRSVDPPIRTATSVLLDRLLGSVVEGDEEAGYAVPFVFREVARERLTADETKSVLGAVAERLLTPAGRAVNAARTCSGVIHALAAGRLDAAFWWAGLLLRGALRQPLSESQLRWLLGRLRIVGAVTVPVQLVQRLGYIGAVMQLSMGYARLGEYRRAAELLRPFIETPMEGQAEPKVRKALHAGRFGAAVWSALCLALAGEHRVFELMSQLTDSDLDAGLEMPSKSILDLLALGVAKEELSRQALAVVGRIIERTDGRSAEEQEGSVQLAAYVAAKLRAESRHAEELDLAFGQGPLSPLLSAVGRGVWLTEGREGDYGTSELTEAVEIARRQGVLASPAVRCRLFMHAGDAAYARDDRTSALPAYLESANAAETGSFEYGWSWSRVGWLSEDAVAFGKAADALRGLGLWDLWARALGARGAVLIRQGMVAEGLACLRELIATYYESRDEAVAPATMVALAHLTRLRMQLIGEPLAEGEPNFPDFAAEVYSRVLSEARPRGGPRFAFHMLSLAYDALGRGDDARTWLTGAIRADSDNPDDIRFAPFLVKRIMEVLSPGGLNADDVRRTMDLFFESVAAGAPVRRDVLVVCLFSDLDGRIDADDGKMMGQVLGFAGDAVGRWRVNDPFWRAQLGVRRAQVRALQDGDPASVAGEYRAALAEAEAGGAASAMIASGHALGFDLAAHAGSLREVAEWQFAVLRGFEMLAAEFERLSGVGRNLMAFWSSVEWRRLSEQDLRTKGMLLDVAVEMRQRGVEADAAAITMLLLLAALFGHAGPAVDWARAQMTGKWHEIPSDVARLLGSSTAGDV